MQTPSHITFRHIDRSPALESQVNEHITQLERFNERITTCHVIVDRPTSKHRTNTPFVVSIELAVPGGVINASNKHSALTEHTDVYRALRDAFDNAKRQLLDFHHA